jgi:hypothetical protein
MEKLTKRQKIRESIANGIAFGLIMWLIDLIPYFSGDDFKWWGPVLGGCLWGLCYYFFLLPLKEKEAAKKEQKQREQEKQNLENK